MAYAQLKTDIAAVIRNNGNQEITGNVLQGALLEMINALGANYQYAGVADTSTTITTIEANVFYLLTEAGTYANMSSSIVHTSGIGIALWNGTAWSYQNVPSSAVIATDATPTEDSSAPISSGGVYNILPKGYQENVVCTPLAENIEQGGLNGTTGAETTSTTVIRMTYYIEGLNPNGTFTISIASGYRAQIVWFDGTSCKGASTWLSGTLTKPIGYYNSTTTYTGCTRCRIIFASSTSGTAITPSNYPSMNFSVTMSKEGIVAVASASDVAELQAKVADPVYIPIYAPSPQLPADGSSEADLNAETTTITDLYAAYDAIMASMPLPDHSRRLYPSYMTLNNRTATDSSGQYQLRTYVLTKRNRYAWKAAERLFAWRNGGTIRYTDSCTPMAGDNIYTNTSRVVYVKVKSYDSATQALTGTNNAEYSRDTASNVAADIVWTQSPMPVITPSSLPIYSKTDTYISAASVIDSTTLSYNSKNYVRCEACDYHTDNKATIFLWANEHGPQSDPADPAIILYRLAKDLCRGCCDNPFLSYLKNYCKVVLLPCANPYGLMKYINTGQNGRNNYNNVNINRNYDTTGWSVQSETDKGTTAGDQPETQYIMNMCLDFDANVAVDIHCLSYITQANEGRCHYEGYIPNSDANDAFGDVASSFGYEYSSYGVVDPTTKAQGCDWLYQVGISGGLIEMNGGFYAATPDGNQHTANNEFLNYTLLLNAIRQWYYGYDATMNFAGLVLK